MSNQYTGISKYYDLWTTSGYYDYASIAREIASIIPKGASILELGVGTSLLVEQYLEVDPRAIFTGVDFTPSLLEIAQQRLGDRITLVEADAVTMNLHQTFDVVVSNGGVWGVLDNGDGTPWQFGGHVTGLEANRCGLQNLSSHIKEGGLLLLHLQKPHQDFEKKLPDNITYSQALELVEETDEHSCFKKSYFFTKNGELDAQEEITITCFKSDISQKILQEADFSCQGVSKNERFAIYTKDKNGK